MLAAHPYGGDDLAVHHEGRADPGIGHAGSAGRHAGGAGRHAGSAGRHAGGQDQRRAEQETQGPVADRRGHRLPAYRWDQRPPPYTPQPVIDEPSA